MNTLNRILAVLDGTAADAVVLAKAVALAHQHNAGLELFLCDSERAYALLRAYDPEGVEESRRECLRHGRRYLETLRDTAVGADVRMSVDSACESPLYQGIVRKVLESRPDLVIKNCKGEANDWQLMRACPATLWLSRGGSWRPRPRIAAAIDVSEQESGELVRAIAQTSILLTWSCHGELDFLYSEPSGAGSVAHEARLSALEALARAGDMRADSVHVLSGEPERALPMFAVDRDYDAFIMGALTRQKGVSALVGTLTSRLIETLDCDFVLVKPSTYRTTVELSTAPWKEESESALGEQQTVGRKFVSPWELPGGEAT